MKNKPTKSQPPIIKNDKENPIPVEIIAQAIIEVAEAAKKMKSSKLSKRAVLLLIQDSTPGNIGLAIIERVLDAAASLDKMYIKS